MRSVSEVSRTRAGRASVVIANLRPIQKDESRVNNRFGNGSMTKSDPWCMVRTSDGCATPPPSGSSSNVIPHMSTYARSAASSDRRYAERSCASA
ncbi:Uncharacterised protein [Mycobacteroides abscessus subsp. abscessus]|nr:Uncharacterised protein [Mycobacteroides abscessus subsp. abscessus]